MSRTLESDDVINNFQTFMSCHLCTLGFIVLSDDTKLVCFKVCIVSRFFTFITVKSTVGLRLALHSVNSLVEFYS